MEKTLSDLSPALEGFVTNVVDFAPKLFLALVVLWLGFKLANLVNRLIQKALDKSQGVIDPSLKSFLGSLSSMVLKVLVLLTVAGMVGVEVTSFVALIGAAGLAIGVSLQGSLSNFAGGVMLLLFRPFKVGDFIEAEGHSGTVSSINLVATLVTTADSRRVIIPNGPLANGTIINYTAEAKRRVDITFGIGYDDDIQKAREVIKKIIEKAPHVITTPAPFVGVANLGESSVDLTCRVWTTPEHYWTVFFFLNEQVKVAFDEHEITIPYPHRVVINGA